MTQIKRVVISLPKYLLSEIDRIAAAENINRSEFIRAAMLLYIDDRKRRQLREQMIKGYLEMANINLEMAIEHYGLEVEAELSLIRPVAGGSG
ncbi:MAG: ribbon-helix-helix protein, CopG family [Firmicutes bacterium]|nr:ribbon-helix-helix protein, CopG family [Bacillota bacterium]